MIVFTLAECIKEDFTTYEEVGHRLKNDYIRTFDWEAWDKGWGGWRSDRDFWGVSDYKSPFSTKPSTIRLETRLYFTMKLF